MDNRSRTGTASKVFFYFSPIPLILFVLGFVYATRSLDQWRPSVVSLVSVFISGIGLVAGLRLLAEARRQKQSTRGVAAATSLVSAPLVLMALLFFLVGLLGYFRS
jgi:hypothetical protein